MNEIFLLDQFVYLGSINFTGESMGNNREMGIINSDPQILSESEAASESD
jgi:phosphatidylserine/phosphatidylglycerophosphate/cardiolipin synthase-like enzyme